MSIEIDTVDSMRNNGQYIYASIGGGGRIFKFNNGHEGGTSEALFGHPEWNEHPLGLMGGMYANILKPLLPANLIKC